MAYDCTLYDIALHYIMLCQTRSAAPLIRHIGGPPDIRQVVRPEKLTEGQFTNYLMKQSSFDCVYIYIYIYMYRERQIYTDMYIYIYIQGSPGPADSCMEAGLSAYRVLLQHYRSLLLYYYRCIITAVLPLQYYRCLIIILVCCSLVGLVYCCLYGKFS